MFHPSEGRMGIAVWVTGLSTRSEGLPQRAPAGLHEARALEQEVLEDSLHHRSSEQI